MEKNIDKVPGEVAWLALALIIIGYDSAAVISKRAETLSSALWRSLANPVRFPLAAGVWLGLTWHLFGNNKARTSYKTYGPVVRNIKTRKVTK